LQRTRRVQIKGKIKRIAIWDSAVVQAEDKTG